MRDIEYRAFVKKDKKMLPVTDLCFNETEAVGVSGCGDPYCTMCVDWYSFDDVVLMQYTERQDINNNKIFEKDIATCQFFDKKITGLIEFIEFMWAVNDRKNQRLYQLNEVSNIEVVGNVEENPELLGD
ncbi:YopX family protein [Listeria cossartiae]|uniref:YopX family protein n=1 Tax=Listeria cossartiae TaxID=2838249 RepID=UPI001E633CCB|nr:YopX family protein [Listeria cossartiae]MCD2225527.1 YopX family protein [Listeria cossartiae]MCD2240278.1 YopX family protein [Listeria cossartiae]